jgi:glycosyltransferase involved in cell wall biosynthesis
MIASKPMQTDESVLTGYEIAVILPAWNEGDHIEAVLASMPGFVRHVIVVDDASSDNTAVRVLECAEIDSRIVLVRHERNQGVGGAMLSGFRKALELQADLVVKMDADGQMPAALLPQLLLPLIRGEADYAKGNRFHDFRALASMPKVRRAGNMMLSFLTKCAVGYWSCFDPCNGYVAIRGEVLAQLPLHRIARSWFFETSMLAELYLLNAVVRDVPMPARYGNERSHLSVTRVLLEFPPRLFACFCRRLLLKNFIYDFSMESVYLLAGVPMLVVGLIYGLVSWFHFARAGLGAPTGTVVIPAMLITLGVQFLLSAISEDMRCTPKEPLCTPAIRSGRRSARREDYDEAFLESSASIEHR